jgi:hypothetical protein
MQHFFSAPVAARVIPVSQIPGIHDETAEDCWG